MSARLKYVSPTSIDMFYSNYDKWYMYYLRRMPRSPQTLPMAVGSAFDCHVKEKLVPGYLEEHWKGAVEVGVRGSAAAAGAECMSNYVALGGYDRLLSLLDGSDFVCEDTVLGDVEGVPVLGKPDIWWKDGVLDWKVNGYCSAASPRPGYSVLLPGFARHARCGIGLNEVDAKWARQLYLYGRLVGGCDRYHLHQLVWRNGNMRVAIFDCEIDNDFCDRCVEECKEVWSHRYDYDEELEALGEEEWKALR